jgi:hypothetical protein
MKMNYTEVHHHIRIHALKKKRRVEPMTVSTKSNIFGFDFHDLFLYRIKFSQLYEWKPVLLQRISEPGILRVQPGGDSLPLTAHGTAQGSTESQHSNRYQHLNSKFHP